MAVQIVDVTPGDRIAPIFELVLGGVAVRLRMRWMDRIRRWLYVIEAPDGAALTVPGLVASGGVALWDSSDPRTPPGALQWTGTDPYERADLGDGLRLLYDRDAFPAYDRQTYRALVLARTPRGVTFDSTSVTWDSTVLTFDQDVSE